MSSPDSVVAQLRELLPDASDADLRDVAQSSTSVEHAISLYFSRHERSSRPKPAKPQQQQSSLTQRPREVESVEDEEDEGHRGRRRCSERRGRGAHRE